VTDDGRVTLGRGHHVFGAVVDQLDRAPRLEREQRRMARDHRRVLFLPAEPATGLRLHHPNEFDGGSQKDRERLVDVVRALDRAVNGESPVLGDRDDAVGLDIDVFLVPGLVRPFHDHVGLAESPVELPLFDQDFLERGG
jgi:hypothetical protein